ncbi:MAG: glycosyltransferase family 9 protein [Nevskia sp.]|nr:glycosyltransferase family 9 protein [Nevskia sp.]
MSKSRGKYQAVTPEFGRCLPEAGRILVVDIAGLGDLVHALPALWSIRCAFPRAQLHCIANANWAALLRLTPWIDRVWSYAEREKSIQASDFAQAWRIRAERFDVSINLMGSNRSCIIGRLSGARYRLGRKPFEEHRPGWRLLNTHVMESPYRSEPRYLQKWKCLQQAGIAGADPEFVIEPALVAPPADLVGGVSYLHVSPYASAPQKELPPAQMAELLEALAREFPQQRLVVSCAPLAREIAALQDLLARLPFRPWRVYPGILDAAELFRVIQGAAAHLGGDTGSLHLAWLAGTPAVCWSAGGLCEWVPEQATVSCLTTALPRVDYLRGIETGAVVAAARSLLESQQPSAALPIRLTA